MKPSRMAQCLAWPVPRHKARVNKRTLRTAHGFPEHKFQVIDAGE